MGRWIFRTYRLARGTDEVDEWYSTLRPRHRAKVLTGLEYLRDQPIQDWVRPRVGSLHGECKGLREIRFKLDKVPWRLIGFHGPERNEFTIVIVAMEKDGRFEPHDTCKMAQHRKLEIINNLGNADEWDF